MKSGFISFALGIYSCTGISVLLLICNACQKPVASVTTTSSNCKFIAGLAEGDNNREVDFKTQLAAFNQNYMLYQKGVMTAQQGTNPYHQTPYHLGNDPHMAPNNLIDSFSRTGDHVGLMIGFGKPVSTENIVILYLALLKENLVQLDSHTCKVTYENEKINGIPIFYSFNTRNGEWSTMDKSIIDKWVGNLYDADPTHAPAFKGFYIHHQPGSSVDMDENLYVGLKRGDSKDTLNIFSLNHPFTETANDIQFTYTRFTSSSGHLGMSTTFQSGDDKNMVRPCPPNCL